MKLKMTALALASLCAVAAHAETWSDTALSVRAGNKFAEPFNPNPISKTILGLTHVGGYKYGTNFFNVDFLMSDSSDPASVGSKNGAQEIYAVYRNTVDLEKATGTSFKYGIVRGLGVSGGFDLNTKTDAGYNSKKQMLAVGPTVMFDVPGFLNVTLYQLWESNAPYNGFSQVSTPRYHYDPHAALEADFGIPFSVGSVALELEGYAQYIAAKGKNEFGGDTKAETHVDARVMYDIGAPMGAGKNTFKVGFEYEYWKNKFGNDANGFAGPGAFAKTPMIRAEYHF